MATLPTYQRQVGTPGPGGQSRASGQDPIGQSLQQLGRAGMGISEDMRRRDEVEQERQRRELAKKEDEDARAWVSSALSDSHVKWAGRIQELENTAEPGAPKFAKTVLDEFDKYRTEAVGAAPNESAKKFYAERLDSMRTSLFGQAVNFEARENAKWKVQQAKTATDNLSSTAALDPTMAKTMLAEQEAIFGGYENKTLASTLITGMRGAASYAAVSGMIERDPAVALSLMDKRMNSEGKKSGEMWVDMLDGEKLLQLRSRAITDVQRLAVEGRNSMAYREKDVQAIVLDGGIPPAGLAPSKEEYVSAFGPEGERRWQENVGNYLELSGAMSRVRSASFEERRALIEAAQPDLGEGYAGKRSMQQNLVEATQMMERQLAADPAAYALKTSPRVAQAQAVMARVLSDPATPEADKPAVVDFYARTMLAEQQRLGITQMADATKGGAKLTPKLLTTEQSNRIAAQFYDQQTGGAKSAELIASLEGQWGRYWPQVFNQMASENKLPPSALVIPNMEDKGARGRLAQVSSMKEEDLKALLAPSDPKDLRDSVLSEFQTAAPSFVSQGPAGNRTMSVFMDQAERLAMLYRSQGKSIKEASKQAYQETMGARYEFQNTYRVPKKEDPAKVAVGAEFALSNLADARVFAPAGLPLTEEALRTQTIDAIKANGLWVTNKDESGLRLMVMGQDGTQYQVVGADGNPVERSWSDLRAGQMQVQQQRTQGKAQTIQREQRQQMQQRVNN